MAAILTTCGGLLAAGAGFLYGFVYLGIAFSYSLTKRDFWIGSTAHDRAHLARASRNLWSLSDHAGSLVHKFLKLDNGTQLHYLSPVRSPQGAGILVICLHGFPDSAHLFDRYLDSALAAKAKFVAVDLPGCGGSDSLKSYGPGPVLDAVAQCIVKLKQRYLPASGRCILVGHDWGGVVAYRIVAETKGLIDHAVLINTLWPAYAEEQLRSHISKASALLSARKWREGMQELSPVMSQLKKSSYTYMLTLPLPKAKTMPGVAFCLLKYAHSMEYNECVVDLPQASKLDAMCGGDLGLWSATVSASVAATRLASAYGPSAAESSNNPSQVPRYGPSVYARSKTHPPGDWDQRVRLYSDGLLRDEWKQSWHEDRTSTSSANFALSSASRRSDPDAHVEGTSRLENKAAFNYPVSIIFGLQDIALDPRIVLDGIEKYFVAETGDAVAGATHRKSRIVRLPDCGHWSILEEKGVEALETVLQDLVAK